MYPVQRPLTHNSCHQHLVSRRSSTAGSGIHVGLGARVSATATSCFPSGVNDEAATAWGLALGLALAVGEVALQRGRHQHDDLFARRVDDRIGAEDIPHHRHPDHLGSRQPGPQVRLRDVH